jgi:hypothetical protein
MEDRLNLLGLLDHVLPPTLMTWSEPTWQLGKFEALGILLVDWRTARLIMKFPG